MKGIRPCGESVDERHPGMDVAGVEGSIVGGDSVNYAVLVQEDDGVVDPGHQIEGAGVVIEGTVRPCVGENLDCETIGNPGFHDDFPLHPRGVVDTVVGEVPRRGERVTPALSGGDVSGVETIVRGGDRVDRCVPVGEGDRVVESDY